MKEVFFVTDQNKPNSSKILFITENQNGFHLLQESGSIHILEETGVSYELIVDVELSSHISHQTVSEATVYIVMAENSVLPTKIFHLKKNSFLVVAAINEDALISIIKNPAHLPFLCSGVDLVGLEKATIAGCQIISLLNLQIKKQVDLYLERFFQK
jgi:phosphoribosylcarboxyaminoimidazole (NCAIR) mutase